MAQTGRFAGPLLDLYRSLKRASTDDLRGREVSDSLCDLVTACLEFLNASCAIVKLNSRVTDKTYVSYTGKEDRSLLSRPINREFFERDSRVVRRNWQAWNEGRRLSDAETRRLTYTMAMAYFVAVEFFDRNNKKAPATYFECLIGHLFAKALGVNPTKKVTLNAGGTRVRLTMDFLFDLGKQRSKVHLPVKTSTRERVVQAWAHQRLLDAAFGRGTYKGILVVFSETKLDLQTREVVEICVPDQWLAYQMLLAHMERIYYFDTPRRYADLAAANDNIDLKQFTESFREIEAVLNNPQT
ncbi:MAG TPA: hypothetical protein VGS20_12630 [Candidatus Acidoferrales bacterium]|nr:hypothetical protein [Candidatus Acidoferrales bacterium]